MRLSGDPAIMLSCLVPRDLVRALGRLAARRGTTRSALIREAIEKLVRQPEAAQ